MPASVNHGIATSLPSTVLFSTIALKCWSTSVGRDLAGQVDEVVGQDARPDHVDLEDVDVGRAGGQQLLVERQPLGRRVGRADDLDLVAGLLRPGLRTFLAELQLEADRTTGDGDGLGVSPGTRNQS